MPTYNAAAVSDAVIAHKKGITLQQARALRDNMLAIAEGDASAPRIQPAALEMFYGRAQATRTTAGSSVIITVTDLDAVDYVLAVGRMQATTDGSMTNKMTYQTSSNNGSTWGASIDLFADIANFGAMTFADVIDLTAANAVRINVVISAETGTTSVTGTASILGIGGLVV